MILMREPYYYNTTYVEYFKLVEIEDLSNGNTWYCCLTPTLNKRIVDIEKADVYSIESFSNEGEVWVHTPLGGALFGRKVGDIIFFYEKGYLKQYKIRRVLS